ncbi:hypothetical protein TRIATDRAFT_263319 [Trichoderma atroviride IMI 206040]|uniref:Peptidase M20 dimerisation domain-containing protein n=1 Tax=Hypocrea atroviridis (strain ATCC 20476 / IMI 206040) TaxID=452589 RepID=G9NQN3_HYPAI|nr:uncharacterized protein TRIATDRAFT_263319 [Trichoderma atroviride IMI 206040]EHK46856.1 hypothetical protein TRIATDRAFT_263319 [Trichoderma atroviride IMI 206040]
MSILSTIVFDECYTVKCHTYGLATSFEAEFGSGGRLVVYCAEYDALPDIGHACLHNFIAASSVAAFIGLARALKGSSVEGRVRILGTPAEEALGGKIEPLQAGAFADDIAATLMLHPLASRFLPQGVMGNAGSQLIANAGAAPWNGLNALDAAVATYTSHIRPNEHINAIMEGGGIAVSIIPAKSRMVFGIQTPTWHRQRRSCSDHEFVNVMAAMGTKFIARSDKPFTASTDMGNVSYQLPASMAASALRCETARRCIKSRLQKKLPAPEAFDVAMHCAKGLALLGWKVLRDDGVATEAMRDFNEKE